MPFKTIDGVSTSVVVPTLGNVTPTLKITWDKTKINLTGKELQEKLRFGNPSIEIAPGVQDTGISTTAWVLKPGEEKIVARRIKEELSKK